MKELYNKEDFVWYKRKLDADRKYEHDHYGEPEEYPCRVRSEFYDDPNGPYTYNHSFIYKQEHKCESCGHTQKIWPQVDE